MFLNKTIVLLYPSLPTSSPSQFLSFEPSHEPYFQADNIFFSDYYCCICMRLCMYVYAHTQHAESVFVIWF